MPTRRLGGIVKRPRACSVSAIAHCSIRSRNTVSSRRPTRTACTTTRAFGKQNSSLEAIVYMTLNTKLIRGLQSTTLLLVVSAGLWAQSGGASGQPAPAAKADKHTGAAAGETTVK